MALTWRDGDGQMAARCLHGGGGRDKMVADGPRSHGKGGGTMAKKKDKKKDKDKKKKKKGKKGKKK